MNYKLKIAIIFLTLSSALAACETSLSVCDTQWADNWSNCAHR